MEYLKLYASVVANTNKSIKRKVKIETLLDGLKKEELRAGLLGYANDELNFWDYGVLASRHLSGGDKVITVCKDIVFVCEISSILHDKTGTIGDCIGWARQHGQPWANVAVVDRLKIYKNVSEKIRQHIIDTANSRCEILEQRSAFYRVPEHENIEGMLGSNCSVPLKENEEKAKHITRKKIAVLQSVNVPKELSCIINKVQTMQNLKYSERDCESFVEELFIYLGYKKPENIKYRQGSVDISIVDNGKPLMVVEVKKSSNLSRENKSALDQAYRYSLKNGSRYVVISNSDYYAFYDRDQGRSIENNFLRSFNITCLSEEDIDFIETFRYDNLSTSTLDEEPLKAEIILPCKNCRRNLRFPNIKAKLKITCPFCKEVFYVENGKRIT